MDKRRKSAYIEYNYEAAYQKKLHNLEEVNAEKMLKEGKVKSLYATKELTPASANLSFLFFTSVFNNLKRFFSFSSSETHTTPPQ